MPSNSVPFVRYGVLEIAFILIIFSNFILTVLYLLTANDEQQGVQTNDLVVPLIIASSIMLLTSCVVFYILIFRARTNDLVGNLRIRKRTASFKVAQLSWILTGIETVLRLVGLFHFKSHALAERNPDISYWWAIASYHLLLLFQTTFQSE